MNSADGKPRALSTGELIGLAAKASRRMSIPERAKLMVKAGLVSQEQVEQALRKLNGDEKSD